MGIVVGIDLGTTNSAIAVRKIDTVVLKNRDGSEFTPSVFSRIPSGGGYESKVGTSARLLKSQYPEYTVTSIKRLIGRERSHPAIKDLELAKIFLTNTEDESPILKVGDLELSPEQISAEILKQVVEDGEKALGSDIDAAVITVPAYFTDVQKHATQLAGELAGIKVLRVLSEPTAAALSLKEDDSNKDFQTILVFDLGGGTFDLSLISNMGSQYMEISKGGDMWLGGDDIDSDIVDFVLKQVAKEREQTDLEAEIEMLTTAEKNRFFSEMGELAEKAKISLSTEQSYNMDHFGILKDKKGNLIDIDVDLTRVDFEGLIQPRIDRLIKLTSSLLQEAHFKTDMVDKVLLVGGTAQIPAIKAALEKFMGGEKVVLHEKPMTAVAEGAAKFATSMLAMETLENEGGQVNLLHACAHDYFIKLAGGESLLLAEKGSPLPLQVTRDLEFAQEGQQIACVKIFNKVNGVLECCGQAWFDVYRDLTLLEKGAVITGQEPVKVSLTFTIDLDNIISIEVVQKGNKGSKDWKEKLARSEVQQVLLQELEDTLARTIQKGGHSSLVELFSVIGKSIQKAGSSDVQERRNAVTLARHQIATLANLHSIGGELSWFYYHHHTILKSHIAVVEEESRKKYLDILSRFEQELNALTDADAIIDYWEQLLDLRESNENYNLLIRTLNSVLIREKDNQHAQVRSVRQRMAEFSRAVAKEDSASISVLRLDLERETSTLGLDEMKGSSFDRDLRLS